MARHAEFRGHVVSSGSTACPAGGRTKAPVSFCHDRCHDLDRACYAPRVRAPLRKDLRDAIINAGIELGDSLGIEGVTMRAIAERLSVSVTQLYQHFENKDAIVREIRFFGLARLDAALGSSHEQCDPLTRLSEMARSYLEFARNNRWLYAVMFDGAIIDWANVPDHDRLVALGPLSTTRTVFVDGVERGMFASDLDPDGAVLVLWASLHGCASLGLRGWLDVCHDGSTSDGCAQAFATHLVASFRPRVAD